MPIRNLSIVFIRFYKIFMFFIRRVSDFKILKLSSLTALNSLADFETSEAACKENLQYRMPTNGRIFSYGLVKRLAD